MGLRGRVGKRTGAPNKVFKMHVLVSSCRTAEEGERAGEEKTGDS